MEFRLYLDESCPALTDLRTFVWEEYPTIEDIRNFRFIINGASYFPIEKNIGIEAKPYMEKLKALPPDSLYFAISKRSYITTQ